MLFISWHTKYLKNCKWYFQAVFDFIFADFADLFSFLKFLTVTNWIKKQVNSNFFLNYYPHQFQSLFLYDSIQFKLLFLFLLIIDSQSQILIQRNEK